MPEVVLTGRPIGWPADVELGLVEDAEAVPRDIVLVPCDAIDPDSCHGGHGHGAGAVGLKVGKRGPEMCEGSDGHSDSALLLPAPLTVENATTQVMSVHGAVNGDIVTNDDCSRQDGRSESKRHGIEWKI